MDLSTKASSFRVYAPYAQDVYGLTLGYYAGDYSPIGNTGATAFSLTYSALSTLQTTGNELYNGNISQSTLGLSLLNGALPVGYSYGYDQLNRIVGMRQHSIASGQGSWSNSNIIDDYKEDVAYDANGNILKYLRNGTTAGNNPLGMDSLTYFYNSKTNQLNVIHDSVPSENYSIDLDNQSPNNYAYDSTGNLIKDNAAGISGIAWTVYGKPKQISKSVGNISFGYDAGGNRILKNATGTTQFYIRDAQSNILSTYSYDGTNLKWTERDLYGSNRAGIWNWNQALPARVMLPESETDTLSDWYLLGSRDYELSNHLGNVLSVITDKKIGVSSGSSVVDYYKAEVLSQQDYYPFGMMQPERQYELNNYAYGFNGKRMDNEIYGIGNFYDYGMRMYDPRVGRFGSVDPLTGKYPELTPYQFASNSPVIGVDIDGQEVENAFYRLKRWAFGITSLKMNNANSVIGDVQQQNYTVNISNPTRSTKDLQYRIATNINSIFGTGNGSFKFAQQQEKGKITEGDYITIDPNWKGLDIAVKVTNVTIFNNDKIGTDVPVKGFSMTLRTLQGHVEVGAITFTAEQITNPQTGENSFDFNIFSTSQIDNGIGSIVAPYSRKLQQQVWNQVLKNVATFMGGDVEGASQRIDTYNPSDFQVIKNNGTKIGTPKQGVHPETETKKIKIEN